MVNRVWIIGRIHTLTPNSEHVFSFKRVARLKCLMTSASSKLPDWKIHTVSSQDCSPLLISPLSGEVQMDPCSSNFWKKGLDRSESRFCRKEERDWKNSWPLVNHFPSLRTRVPSLAYQGAAWRWRRMLKF